MSSMMIGILGIVVFTLLVLVGLPIASSMLLVGVVGYGLITTMPAALNMVATDLFTSFTSYNLSVVAMFTWMGTLALWSGIGSQMFNFANKLLGHRRGGLYIASQVASAAFGAVCGSGPATVTTIGAIALPEMKKKNYDLSIGAASVAAGGGLGLLIPPSMGAIIYASCTGESIGRQFIGGIGAGILLMLVNILVINIFVRKHPSLAPAGPKYSWRERISSMKGGMAEIIIIFTASIVGLAVGLFTPTESGAVGCFLVLVVCLARRRLTWKAFLASLSDTAKTVGMIMYLIAAATVFSRFIAVSTLSTTVCKAIATWNAPPIAIMFGICLIFMIGGCFIDGPALTLLLAPIFYPVVTGTFGYSGVWFGIILLLLGLAGALTPPVGVSVYVAKGLLPEVPLEKVFKAIWPFVLALLVTIALCSIFPEIITFLPNLMMG